MIIIKSGNYRVVLVTREFLLFSQTLYGDVAQLARVLDWQLLTSILNPYCAQGICLQG